MGALELPLVLFTILTEMAVGLALFSAARQWAVVEGPGSKVQAEWLTIAGLLALAVVASFFHLGHPLGAVRMLSNLDTAWLSREILGVTLFGVLVAATFFTLYKNSANGWLIKLTALVGLVALFATAMTYMPPSLVAIENGLPFVFFLLTALILGSALCSYFAPADKQPFLSRVLSTSLLVSLVVYLLVPLIWLSGSTVMRMTGTAYLASPLHWIRIGLSLLALLVVWRMKQIPAWLPLLLLAGEIAGRVAFFALTVSSAANLGGLY